MQSDEEIIFIYRDNGIGVDSSLHHKIFEPFYTSKRNCGGSGLGLNLVFNLITQKLKGQLKFESTVGEGVCFTLTVPQNLPSSVDETDSSEAEI